MSSSDYITPDYDDTLTFSAIAAAVEMDLVQLREALEKLKADPTLNLDHNFLLPTAGTVLADELAAISADLQTLRDDEQFKRFCLANTAIGNPADLIVNADGRLGIIDWNAIYRSLPTASAAPASLRKRLTAFTRAAEKFGGQVRTQKNMSTTCMLKYYGVHTLPIPVDPEESLQRLGQVDLAYRIVDRYAVEPVLDDIDKALIIETVADVKGPSRTLIEHLQSSIPDAAQTQAIRNRPFAHLVELLESPKAQALAQRLLDTLGWYGAEPGQSTSAIAVYKLLEQAVALDLDATGQLLGNWFKADEYSGKTYKQSLRDIESRLYSLKELYSPAAATLAVLAMRNQLPLDYQIADVPETLRYRRNLIWFRFAQALAIAEVIETGLAKALNYPQLLALREAELQRAGEDPKLMGLYSAAPLLQWAVEHDYYSNWQPTVDRLPEIQKTFSEEYEQPLQNAFLELSKAVPMRLQMVKDELKKHKIPIDQLLERDTSGLPLTTPIVGTGGGLGMV